MYNESVTQELSLSSCKLSSQQEQLRFSQHTIAVLRCTKMLFLIIDNYFPEMSQMIWNENWHLSKVISISNENVWFNKIWRLFDESRSWLKVMHWLWNFVMNWKGKCRRVIACQRSTNNSCASWPTSMSITKMQSRCSRWNWLWYVCIGQYYSLLKCVFVDKDTTLVVLN